MKIEGWFTGKALGIVQTFVIPKLTEAKQLGYWPKGVSRKLRAALNKQSVAIKLARTQEKLFESIKDPKADNFRVSGWSVKHALMFGQFEQAPAVLQLIEKLAPLCTGDDQRSVLRTARQWALDFCEVAELVELLDASRPKPEYVFATLSPTVFKNVGQAMGIALDSIEVPKVEWKKVKITRNGATRYMWIGEILWPEGTEHDRSKFAYGSRAGNDQCHACGHAIRNSHNWVPLIAKSGGKKVLSLWVGKDCAENLFGCKVTGEGRFDGRGQEEA